MSPKDSAYRENRHPTTLLIAVLGSARAPRSPLKTWQEPKRRRGTCRGADQRSS